MFVYIFHGEIFSLTRNTQGQLKPVSGIAPLQTNITPTNGIDELIRIPVSGNSSADIYIATLATGTPVTAAKFKTLQLVKLIF